MIHYEADRRKWTFNRKPVIGDVYSLDLNWVNDHSENLMKEVHMLIILQATFLSGSPLRICAPLTTYKPTPNKKLLDSHYVLRASDYDFLEHDTVVKNEQLITINWTTYLAEQNYLGTIRKPELKEIVMRVANTIGIKEVFSTK